MASKKRKIPRNIVVLETGEHGFPEKGAKEAQEQFMNSSHANSKPIDSLTKSNETVGSSVFTKSFETAARKSPLETDQIQIYRHGIIIRPRVGGLPSGRMKADLGEIISKLPQGTAHIVDEKGTFSIRVNMGSSKTGVDLEEASEDIEENADILEQIRKYIEDEYGDTDWFAFWDTEEAMYE